MLLDRTTYFIKERVAFAKLTDTYDILDPETQQPIGIAREQPPGWIVALRLLVNKRLLPTTLNVYEREDQPPVVSVHRPVTLFRSKVTVTGMAGQPLGYFKSKLLSIGGGFLVFNTQDQQVAEIKGDWKGWNFKVLSLDGHELGTVTKKWAGIGKELFTSADNYMIALNEANGVSSEVMALLLAAGLSIDVIFKESN